MRKIFITAVMLCLSLLSNGASAQSDEVQQLLLNVEKLTQFKQILTEMKKGYQVVSMGYNSVKDISQGNFSLHKTFLDGLMEVSPSVKKYRKVSQIISMEISLMSEYRIALKRFQADKNFDRGEIEYISSVFENLVEKSMENIDELTTILTANKLRMSDDERLSAIDNIYKEMELKLSFLNHFNNTTSALALQRSRAKNDAGSMSNVYGVKKIN